MTFSKWWHAPVLRIYVYTYNATAFNAHSYRAQIETFFQWINKYANHFRPKMKKKKKKKTEKVIQTKRKEKSNNNFFSFFFLSLAFSSLIFYVFQMRKKNAKRWRHAAKIDVEKRVCTMREPWAPLRFSVVFTYTAKVEFSGNQLSACWIWSSGYEKASDRRQIHHWFIDYTLFFHSFVGIFFSSMCIQIWIGDRHQRTKENKYFRANKLKKFAFETCCVRIVGYRCSLLPVTIWWWFGRKGRKIYIIFP